MHLLFTADGVKLDLWNNRERLVYTIDWKDGSTYNGTEPIQMHTYENPGVYNVTLVVTDGFSSVYTWHLVRC